MRTEKKKHFSGRRQKYIRKPKSNSQKILVFPPQGTRIFGQYLDNYKEKEKGLMKIELEKKNVELMDILKLYTVF